jgi:hypothetical protein
MTAAADARISAFFISSSVPEPPNGCRVVATDLVSHFVTRSWSYRFRQVALMCIRLAFPAWFFGLPGMVYVNSSGCSRGNRTWGEHANRVRPAAPISGPCEALNLLP